jgi:putative peptide zinc metalloprotease protein
VISRAIRAPWLRRPAVVVAGSGVALAALLTGGFAVAHAVDGTPAVDPSSSPSTADAQGDNNVAAGVNTVDGRTVYAIRLKLVQTASDTVDAGNAAAAVNAGCSDCTTVAIAFEGVLVIGSPSTFTPDNLALAANVDCSGCTAFADAYQQVVQRSTRVRITGAGRQRVAEIRRDLEGLRTAGLPIDEVIARVKADEAAFADVLLNDCVPVGHVTDPAPSDGPDVSDETAPASAAPSAASDSPSPSDASPEMSASPSSEPSTTAASTESPTPAATSSP